MDPQTKQKRVIDDPEVVRQVVDLLLSPDSRADPAAQGPREPFGFAMIVPVKSADHSVAGYYCPQTHILALGNIATGAWPVSVEGRYTVPSTFGPALFEILGIGSQIAQAESSTAETARGWRSGLVPFWSLERGQLPDDPADTRKHPAQARLGALERGSPEATDPSMAKGWVRSHVALAEGKVYCEVVSPMARHRL